MKNNEECEPVITAARESVQSGSRDPRLKTIVFLANLRDKMIRENFKMREKIRRLKGEE